MDEKTFWQEWFSKKRVFVFLNDNYFNQFKLQAKQFVYLGKQNDIMLVANHSIQTPTTYSQ